jgi:hypothetical protein
MTVVSLDLSHKETGAGTISNRAFKGPVLSQDMCIPMHP